MPFSAWGVPSAAILPWLRMAILSASRSASSRYCVVRKMVLPASASDLIVSQVMLRLSGSSPVVGSSKKMMAGSPISPRAMSSLRRIPPEYVDVRRSAASVRPNCSNSASAVRAGFVTWRSSPIKTRFSRPVRRWSTAANCPVKLMDSRTSASCVATSNPFTVATPASARSNVVKILMTVVLPAPLGPSREKDCSLRSTMKSIPSSTTVLPNDLRRPFTSMAGPASAIVRRPGRSGDFRNVWATGPENTDVAETRPRPDFHRWLARLWRVRFVQAVENFAPRGLEV